MRRVGLLAVVLAVFVSSCTVGSVERTTTIPSAGTTAATIIPTTSTVPDPPPARIGIRVVDGAGEFYLVGTGEQFTPRGHNLVYLRGEETLDSPLSPEVFDPDWVHDQLAEMADLGYNVIRVMFEICSIEHCVAGANERVSEEFLDNAVDLLEIAAEHGIYVWFTSNDLPADSYYAREAFVEGESDFLTTRNVEVYQEYYSDLLNGLIQRGARTDWIMTLDIRNEYVYQLDWYPWTLTSGEFTAANGETYDMGDPEQVKQLSSDGILHWANEMTRTAKEILPDVLVTMATLTPDDRVRARGEDDPRYVVIGDLYQESELDFFNIHGMSGDPANLRWEYLLEGETKPVVTGEFGPHFFFGTIDVAAYNMTWWQAHSCRQGFDGWVTWHWLGDNGRWPAREPLVAESLSPALHPDPCQDVDVELIYRSWRRGTVTASATEPSDIDEFVPSNVTDQNVDTWWSAGAGVPQWVEVDLGSSGRVGRLRMPIGFLTPSGPIRIEVVGRGPNEGDPEIPLHTFEEEIAEGSVLEGILVEPVDGIQYVRFNFVRMNDWVIIHDLEVHAE